MGVSEVGPAYYLIVARCRVPRLNQGIIYREGGRCISAFTTHSFLALSTPAESLSFLPIPTS